MLAAVAAILLSGASVQGKPVPIPEDFPKLPVEKRPIPEPYKPGEMFSGFKLRGSKGWGWTKEQYLEEIPVFAKAKMTFLMNCYLSYFTDSERWINNWWEPIPEAKKKDWTEVVRSCQKNGMQFVFAIHPQLGSSRPYDYDRAGDFEALWQHFALFQGMGVRWFSISLDDISTEHTQPVELAHQQCALVNRVLAKLREKDPGAQMIFCPTYYWGAGTEKGPMPYWKTMATELDPKAYVFWTGPGVFSQTVDLPTASRIRKLFAHPVVLWDNYPVNDRNPALHLGPVIGRDPRLPEVLDGYMTNPMARQNEINRVPMLTCADYAYNPKAYDPWRSIGQAIASQSKSREQEVVLRDLVALYPGLLLRGTLGAGDIAPQEDYQLLTKGGSGRFESAKFIARLRAVRSRLDSAFPGFYPATKATLDDNIGRLEAEQTRRFGSAGR